MFLGFIIPALGAGILALMLYAYVADFHPAVALALFAGAGSAAFAAMMTLVAARMRAAPGEETVPADPAYLAKSGLSGRRPVSSRSQTSRPSKAAAASGLP